MNKKTKKRSPWMRLFVIGPKKTDADVVRTASVMQANDYKHKQIKNGR